MTEGRRCPKCLAEIPNGEAIICPKCHARLRKVPDGSDEPIALDHLNLIEDPSLAGKPVTVEAVVSSTSIPYLAPKVVEAAFEDKSGGFDISTEVIDEKDPYNLKLVGCNEDVKYRRLRRLLGVPTSSTIAERDWRTVYFLRVRPPVFTLEKRGEKVVDERGFEYKSYDIYVTSDKTIMFQPSALIRLEGIPLPNPRTQKTTLLVYEVEFPEEIEAFSLEKLKRLRSKFQGWDVKEQIDWTLGNFEKYSQIVGRRTLALAGFLDFFTPLRVQFNGDIQRGWGNISLIGDTTTAKSETVKKLIMLLRAGMLITAETASTVGLTGTTTQIEREGWFIDWGFLPLCDRRLLAIDGAHKLSSSEWAVLAEAERSGVVNIGKAAKGSAYARTRQIKISNAVDVEADRYRTKNLRGFLYPCQGLATTLDKTSIARLDLAAFAGESDVAPEDINVRFESDYDSDLELLSETLRWCWSSTAEIRFTESAIGKILSEATRMYKTFFSETVPLVSIDAKWKLARLSTALAYLTLSTEDFKTLTVTVEHVAEVVGFLEDEYSRAGLNTLAQEDRYETLTLEDVDRVVNTINYKTKGELDEATIQDVFKFIVLQGRVTRDQIKTKFGISENRLRSLLAVLSNEKMLKSGRGLYPAPGLVQAYKLLVSRLSSLTRPEKTPLTKSRAGQEKLGGSYLHIDNLDNLDREARETGEELSEDTAKSRNSRTDERPEGRLPDSSQKGGPPQPSDEEEALSERVVPIGFVGIRLDSVMTCDPMKYGHIGECSNCYEKPAKLTHVVKTQDREVHMVCKDCAETISKELEARRK